MRALTVMIVGIATAFLLSGCTPPNEKPSTKQSAGEQSQSAGAGAVVDLS